MAPENVALLREMFAAYGREGVQPERADELFTPDVVWKAVDEAPQHGPEHVAAYLNRWESEWAELSTVAEEFVDAGDKVVVTVHFSGRGRASGIEIDARFYEVYAFRDGRIARMDEFAEKDAAFAAAGLASEI